MSQMAESSIANSGGKDSARELHNDKQEKLSSGTPIPLTHGALPWVATWVGLLAVAAFLASILAVAARGKMGFFTVTVAGMVCVLAALFDAWTTRIPNWLTYVAIGVGLAINAAATVCAYWHLDIASKWIAGPGISQSLMGFGVCAVVGIVGLLLARVGGGDIKLLAALGAFLGLADVGPVLIIALTVAVVYALLNLAVFGKLNAVMRVAAMRVLELLYLRRFQMVIVDEKAKGISMIPMAVPLAVGLILAQIFNVKSFFVTGAR